MIQIDLDKYKPVKDLAPLRDINIAKQIATDFNLANTYDDIEINVPKHVMVISDRFFYYLLADRIFNYPVINDIRKSITVIGVNKWTLPRIQDNLDGVVTELLQERKQIDKNLNNKKDGK